MASTNKTIKRLQMGINATLKKRGGGYILISTQPFYSKQFDNQVIVYKIQKAVYDESRDKYKNVEIFSTASKIQVVFFLRDMMYELTDQPIPHDDPKWEEVKRKYAEKHGVIDTKQGK